LCYRSTTERKTKGRKQQIGKEEGIEKGVGPLSEAFLHLVVGNHPIIEASYRWAMVLSG